VGVVGEQIRESGRSFRKVFDNRGSVASTSRSPDR
jgi:hypothetical protein